MNHLGSMATSILSLNNEEPVIKKPDLCHLCRLCAHAHEYLIPIFQGEGIDHDLAMKIKKYLPISVGDDDNLPGQVCYQCASTLIAWHDLFLGCIDADHKLRKLLLENHKDKNETAECIQNGEKNFTVENLTSEISLKLSDSLFSQSNEKIDHHCINEDVIPSRIVAVDSHERINYMTSVEDSDTHSTNFNNENSDNSDQCEPQEVEKSKSENLEIHLEVSRDHNYARNNTTNSNILEDVNIERLNKFSYDSNFCYVCYKTFDTHKTLVEHTKSHVGVEVECCVCHKSYKNALLLINHMKLHAVDGRLPFECEICGRGFLFPSSLKQHQRYKHKEYVFRCSICNKPFRSRDSLWVHVKYKHPKDKKNTATVEKSSGERQPCICEKCGKSFATSSNLKVHINVIHKSVPKKYICEICGRMFHRANRLKLHAVVHSDERNYVCETCGMSFGTKHRLKNHLVCHSEARPYKCIMCSKTFKRQRNLAGHERCTHGIIRNEKGEPVKDKYTCTICNHIFTTKEKLTIHLRRHTGERPYHCEECNKHYISTYTLYIHNAVHHPEKIKRRMRVPNHSNSPGGLKIPRCTAVKKKYFYRTPCEICGKVLSSRDSKNNHMRVHTGERPYQCDICGLALKTATSLHAHKKIHSGEKNYKCMQCGKCFRRAANLRIHNRTHTGEKPYVCNICNRGFAQCGDMRKHKLKRHGVEELPKTQPTIITVLADGDSSNLLC